MKQLLFSILITAFAFSVQAQENTFTKVQESDPAAKAVLEKIRLKYEAYTSMQADFSLLIEIPEEDRIEQKGKMAQAGDQYRLDLEDNSIISDGTTLWHHLKNNNEVQISDAEDLAEEGDILSPKDILKIYESGDYIYVLSDEYMSEGTVIQLVEFKPVDRDSEYHKLRLTVDKKANEIKNIKAFSKDGSRYTLKLTKLVTDKALPQSHFQFDESQHPDIYVEDLRM